MTSDSVTSIFSEPRRRPSRCSSCFTSSIRLGSISCADEMFTAMKTRSCGRKARCQMPSWRPASLSTTSADVLDHAGLLGKPDEAFGREQAQRRMAPAHQRLEAGEVHVGEPRDRLVVDLDLVALDGAAELRSSTTSSARSSRIELRKTSMLPLPLRLAS